MVFRNLGIPLFLNSTTKYVRLPISSNSRRSTIITTILTFSLRSDGRHSLAFKGIIILVILLFIKREKITILRSINSNYIHFSLSWYKNIALSGTFTLSLVEKTYWIQMNKNVTNNVHFMFKIFKIVTFLTKKFSIVNYLNKCNQLDICIIFSLEKISKWIRFTSFFD